MSGAQHGYVDPSTYWQRSSRWNWWGRSSGAVLDWRRSDTKRPLLYAWIWAAQIGVREASTQARPKSSPCIMSMQSWRWIKPWQSKELLGHLQCCPALTHRQMYTLHGVMSVGSQLVRGEFALEGVTQLEATTGGEYLHYLPRSLAKLTFGENFNQSLERVTLPSSLPKLEFLPWF